jgi:hypothetical protein
MKRNAIRVFILCATGFIRIPHRGDIRQGSLPRERGKIVGISRFFTGKGAISGGWRGWREGLGDFPDITVLPSGGGLHGGGRSWRRRRRLGCELPCQVRDILLPGALFPVWARFFSSGRAFSGLGVLFIVTGELFAGTGELFPLRGRFFLFGGVFSRHGGAFCGYGGALSRPGGVFCGRGEFWIPKGRRLDRLHIVFS